LFGELLPHEIRNKKKRGIKFFILKGMEIKAIKKAPYFIYMGLW
jgi:hypothetical protein